MQNSGDSSLLIDLGFILGFGDCVSVRLPVRNFQLQSRNRRCQSCTVRAQDLLLPGLLARSESPLKSSFTSEEIILERDLVESEACCESCIYEKRPFKSEYSIPRSHFSRLKTLKLALYLPSEGSTASPSEGT